jgi:hypothetical protein
LVFVTAEAVHKVLHEHWERGISADSTSRWDPLTPPAEGRPFEQDRFAIEGDIGADHFEVVIVAMLATVAGVAVGTVGTVCPVSAGQSDCHGELESGRELEVSCGVVAVLDTVATLTSLVALVEPMS